MKIDKYISDLRRTKNVIINVIDGNLKIKASENDLTEEIIKEIKEKKEDILDFFKGINGLKNEITKVEEQEHYSLSHAQRRLWIIDQLADEKGVYNVPMTHSFMSLNLVSFKKALMGLLSRHEILHTTIHMIDGEPRQLVHKLDEFEFEVTNLKVEDNQIDAIIASESIYPLDLTKSPIRATLIECKDGSYVFVFILHHIVTDAWSMNVLSNDFSALYEHYETGKALELPDLRIQYKDYSFWQHEQLRMGNMNVSRDYWLKRFSGEIPLLKLPLDYKREKSKNQSGAEISFNIDSKTVEALMPLGNERGSTLFMVMVTLVKILLYRYTGQEDIIVGTPVSGRDHQELENQVGFYSNTIVLRSTVKESDNFNELLSKVSEVMLEGYDHQFYPYDLLVDELKLDRDMNRNPLFDVMISLDGFSENNEDNEKFNEEYSDEIKCNDIGVNKFDLSFSFNKLNNGCLNVIINYSTSLFEKNKMIRMAGHIKNLIMNIFENKECKVSEIEYLTKEERNQIINVFNNTNQNYNLDRSIKELIEKQVEKNPNEICLLSDEGTITFKQMNALANQLAHYLSEKHNVSKGNHIGISMDIGVHRVIAMISLIKLGAVYIPIDPSYPEERKQYIITDTQLKHIITEDFFKISESYSVISINKILSELNSFSKENINVKIAAEDIFTILYTSGSTGNPKGVLIKNIGLVNRMQWLWNEYGFNENDVIYQKTPFVFDVSIGEFFMPLCFGAKLLIAFSDTSQDVLENISKYNVTYIHFSPTMLNIFLEFEIKDVHKMNSLRYVFASGEELLKETVKRYYSKLNVPLINLYGPTEASIEVSAYETKKEDEIIPIGKPIANVNLYIMDTNYELMPIGITGEIGIAGIGLAKGYLNQPEMTNERFVENKHSSKKNQKIYKTGDIGRWNEKGEIEFLGRKDNQIRIGGSRIEPGEIESKILEHPDVQEVAVVVNEDSFKNNHLIAYYVKRASKTEVIQESISKEQTEIKKSKESETKVDLGHKVNYRINELFEKAVEANPNNIALLFEGKEMSYRALNNRANQLANLLKEKYNLGNGDSVGVIMKKSEKMIISILAVLKIGAAYVPIDEEYPDARIKYILDDSEIKSVILDKKNEDKEIFKNVSKIVYDEIENNLNTHLQTNNLESGSANDLCYICYTSGSTGKPKGVMVEHHSVSDYIFTFIDYFNLSEDDIIIQQSSISFDTAVEEIFPTLCSGGKLVILPNGGRDIDEIIAAINDDNATILSTTPLVINELNLRFDDLTRLPRVLISGGDELRSSYINKIVNSMIVYNTYGPTETTICASFAKIDANTKCNIIGTPIANHIIYLLDDSMESLPSGEIGEIYIAGPGLARGYINKKEETDKYFVPNPIDGGLFYKTGDLGKWNEEGLIEFCGRKDNQVKIRGYRVEPAEVDQIINQYEGIVNCFTMSKADLEGNKHLVSYYIATNSLDSEELRIFLNDQIPHYMVPDYFVRVDDFPRTINGKINTDKLPVPYALTLDIKLGLELKDFLKKKLPLYMVPTHFRNLEKLPVTATGKVDRKMLESKDLSFNEKQILVAPKNKVEKKMLEIWEKCLSYPVISTDINFFEIGGNSIKATQILSSIFKELECNIALKDIFNNPTIIELSQLIINQNDDKELIVKLNKIDSNLSNLYFIPPIIGSSTIFKDLAIKLDTYYNIYGLQYKGFDYDVSFDKSIQEMANTFVKEIKKTNEDKAVSILGYSMGVTIAFEVTKILESEGYDVNLIFLDRGINEETDGHDIDIESVNEILEMELKFWLKEIKEVDSDRIKKLTFNSLQVLNNYKVEGKVKSKIITIEASKNLERTEMKYWKEFTSGDFKHFYIDTDHYGILNPENLSRLSKLIISGFTKYHFDENEYNEADFLFS